MGLGVHAPAVDEMIGDGAAALQLPARATQPSEDRGCTLNHKALASLVCETGHRATCLGGPVEDRSHYVAHH